MARGDRVVVEVSAGEFVEGTVTQSEAGRLRVQATLGGEVLQAGEADVLAVKEQGSTLAEGRFGICGLGEARWMACRIKTVRSSGVEVETDAGEAHTLSPGEVLVPGELTQLNLERRFARSTERAAYLSAVRAAGPPPIDPEWRPDPAERVLVRRGSDWVSARIRELERDGAYVVWIGAQRATKVDYRDVRPEPPYPIAPWVGAYVLVRPAGEARPWEAARLQSFGEDESAVLVDDRGDRQLRGLRDLVPLGPSPAPTPRGL